MRINALLQRVFENWPAKALSFVAAMLLLVFHDITRLEERFVSVPLAVQIQSSLMPASPYPRLVRVRIRGEADQVLRVLEEDIEAVVDLTRFTEEGTYQAQVVVTRRGGGSDSSALELSVEPGSITVTIEQRMVKSVEVIPTTSGFPPSGYELSQSLMTPSSVEIEGPRSRLDGLTRVRTEDIELSNRREPFTERVRLVAPDPLVRFPGGDIVEFRGIVEEAVALHTFEGVEVVVTGLRADLRLAQNLPAGTVRVQARQLDLARTSSADVQLLIDASGIEEAGQIRLPVRAVVPHGFVVLRYDPLSMVLLVEAGE